MGHAVECDARTIAVRQEAVERVLVAGIRIHVAGNDSEQGLGELSTRRGSGHAVDIDHRRYTPV